MVTRYADKPVAKVIAFVIAKATKGVVGVDILASASTIPDTHITYNPRIPFAQTMVTDTLATQSRLKGLRIYTLNAAGEPAVLASKMKAEVGTTGGKTERDAITEGTVFHGRTRESTLIVMPLRDRNGDPIAAVWLEMETFTGQTEQNAVMRARPIVNAMQTRVQTLAELTD
jgi:hypothetical protein